MTSIEREKIEALARKAKTIRDLWLRESDELLPIHGPAQPEADLFELARQSEPGNVNKNIVRIHPAEIDRIATDNEKEMPE